MFAVIKTGGRQYRVVPDDVLEIGKIAGEAIYMLDVFQKKSKEGKATPKRDIDRIVGRIGAVRQWRRTSEGKTVTAELLSDLRRRQAELDEKERKNALKSK